MNDYYQCAICGKIVEAGICGGNQHVCQEDDCYPDHFDHDVVWNDPLSDDL